MIKLAHFDIERDISSAQKRDILDIAVLGAAVLDKRVNELRLDEVCGVELVEDEAEAPEIIGNPVRGSDPDHPDLGVLPHLGLEVVLDPAKDGEASHQDRVGVVPF